MFGFAVLGFVMYNLSMETQNILKPSRELEGSKTTPKDFFIQLGVLVSLYVSVISIMTLIFSIIDQLFPKEFSYTDPYAGGVSMAMAMLIVAFPLCILFTRALSKEELISPEKRYLLARKVVTYLTLFIAIAVVAIDIIMLLNSFFSGEEITASFALKVFFTILVIGTVAGYYLYDLRRRQEDDGSRVRSLYAYCSSAFIILAFGLGFFVMGSPYTQKEKRFDAVRVSDLQGIQYQIIAYWQAKQKLPAVLADLNDPLKGFTVPVDPKTKEQYTYTVKGKLSFEICATFSKETPKGADISRVPSPMYAFPYKNGGTDEIWDHTAGQVCFVRTIDPEIYPPYAMTEKGLLKTIPTATRLQ